MQKTLVQQVLGVALLFGVTAGVAPLPSYAQEPVKNVDPRKHGNLAAAQNLSRQAFDKLTAAQTANEFDMAGHAARAKDLLRRANEEMKLAALAANRKK